MKVSETTTIAAPIERVFEVFSDVANAEQRISGITKLEVLSDITSGKGVRWRETRTMFGKEATEEMEITEIDSPKMYKVEAESHGTHYTTHFYFEAMDDSNTKVTWEFEGQPLSLGAKLMIPLGFLMKGSVKKAMMGDITDLKQHIESAVE